MTVNRLWRAVIVAFVLLSPFLGTSTPSIVVSQNRVAVDPGPLAKILQDTVTSILLGEYENSLKLCETALNISLSQDISYYHAKLYKELIQIVNLLIRVDRFKTIKNPDKAEIEATIYELYIAKLELSKNLDDYISTLSKLFVDPSTRSIIIKVLRGYARDLESMLDNIYVSLLQLYMEFHSKGIKIEISHPKRIFGGDVMDITIGLLANASISYANVTMSIVYGDVLTDTISTIMPIGKNVTLQIRVPGAENATFLGVELSAFSSAKIFVFSTANIGNVTLRGYAVSNFTVDFEYPSIHISIPNTIEPGKTVTITVNASIVGKLKMYIYVDAISTKNLITTALIAPGVNLLNISIPMLTQGAHQILFVTEPSGRYIAYSFSYPFKVYLNRVEAMAKLNPLVIAPISKTVLDVYVNASTPYTIYVYVNGKLYINYPTIESRAISINLDLPAPLLIQPYIISVNISFQSPGYNPIGISKTIYVINIVTFSIATTIVSALITTIIRMGYVVSALRYIGGFLNMFSKRTKKNVKSVDITSKQSFRKPCLVHLYKKLISIIATYIEPPKAWETLREFYRRLDKRFYGIAKDFIKKFLEMYEEDLYSNHVIDVEKAEKFVRMVEELEGK